MFLTIKKVSLYGKWRGENCLYHGWSADAENTGEEMILRLYFNNFRVLKAHITSLRAAIAIHLMKHHDMCFPVGVR